MNEHAHDNHYEAQQEALAQAANDAAGEAAYNEAVEEPTGYMRPCERCNGSGAVHKSMSSYLTTCPDCDGTGIHQADEPEAPSYESLLEEIAALRQQLADAQAENARLGFQVAASHAYIDSLIATIQFAFDKLDAHIGLAYNFPKVYSAKTLLEGALERYKSGSHDLHEATFSTKPAPVPVADAPQPLAEVTLTESEIDWLAKRQNRLNAGEYREYDQAQIVGKTFLQQVISGKPDAYYTLELTEQYRTAANYKAIANRRKQLGL